MKMQRQFIVDDEHQPIAISLPDDSVISVQTSQDFLRPQKPEDCCEQNAFCLYPIVQTLIGLVDLGAFYVQYRLVKVNNEEKPEPLLTFPGHKIAFVSFLLSIIFQEAFLWLERDSRRTAIFSLASYIGTIFVITLVWFYQEQHGREYKGELGFKIQTLLIFVMWLAFLLVAIVYVVRLTKLIFQIAYQYQRR